MMESKIPLPTDNIYKFYALFGLVLVVFSAAAFLYVHSNTNTLGFAATIEYEELDSKENPTAVELKRKEILEKRVKIAVEDKQTFSLVLYLLFLGGCASSAYGFIKWHRVLQPKLDRLLELQIQKAELDIKKPKREPFRASNS